MMEPKIQYKMTFKTVGGYAPPPICGDGGTLCIDSAAGEPKYGGHTIIGIFVYYSWGAAQDFTLVLNDGETNDYVEGGQFKVTAADDETWPEEGGCRWERTTAGHLQLQFTPPEHPLYGAAHEWTFSPFTPPVVLKIKIKRQDQGFTAATACIDWPE